MLPLSTPGSCCGHNLNMHSGNGLEGTCVVCSCVGFTPDLEGQMAIRPDELRQCRAVMRSEIDGDLRCQGQVTEQTTTQIGRAPCRERVGPYGEVTVVAGP